MVRKRKAPRTSPIAYSPLERSEALVTLTVNRFNYAKTSEETGVSVHQLKRWQHGDKRDPDKVIPELLERAIQHMLMRIPDNLPAVLWAETVALLIGQWLQIKGIADSGDHGREGVRTQARNLLPGPTIPGVLVGDDDEINRIMDEAERILQSARENPIPTGSSSDSDSVPEDD